MYSKTELIWINSVTSLLEKSVPKSEPVVVKSEPVFISVKDQAWLDKYMERVSMIWQIWKNDHKTGAYGGMSMKERDELLGKMRAKLYRLQTRGSKT